MEQLAESGLHPPCVQFFFCDDVSESGVVRSIFVSIATSVAATSLVIVVVVISVVTIFAIGAIAVDVIQPKSGCLLSFSGM